MTFAVRQLIFLPKGDEEDHEPHVRRRVPEPFKGDIPLAYNLSTVLFESRISP